MCSRCWPNAACCPGRPETAGAAAKIESLSTAVSIDTTGTAAAAALARSPLAESQAIRRSRWWVEALAIAWLCWIYDGITDLAPLRVHAALAHGSGLLNLERSLGIDPEHALDRWLAGHPSLGLLVSDYYDNAHFIVTLGVLGFLWWRRADIYRPLRNALVLVNLLAFVVFWLYPVAPPRMLSGFVDVVASTGAIGSWHTGALASAANQYAAMPSLHMAWAGWSALAIWKLTGNRWLRGAGLAHVCITAIAVLSTGNHYVLDVLGGLLALAVSVLLVKALEGLRARMREGGPQRPAPLPGALPGA